MRTPFAALAAALCLSACIPPVRPSGDTEPGALTSFGLLAPAVVGVVDQPHHSVEVSVPWGTDCRCLVAVFSIAGEDVSVDGVEQDSGVSSHDFSRPLLYVVHGSDGSAVSYRVSVVVAPRPGQQNSITQFGFPRPPVIAVVDELLHTILATVPRGTDRSSLVAQYVTTGASVSVADTEQQSGVTINDFTEPVTYLVMAEDGATQTYVVTVTEAPGQDKGLTAFSVQAAGAAAAIDEEHRIVRVRVAEGTDMSALVAVFATTGCAVRVNGATQESGITENDFTRPVEYEVQAEDGSTADYSVRVTSRVALVVNEIDADQVGTDSAEFIELYAPEEVDLWGLVVVLINGGVTPGVEYARVGLSSRDTLAPGSYLVIAGPNVTVAPPGAALTPGGWDLTNRIQNGPSDAVVIWDTLGRRIVDAVTYGGVLHRAVISGETAEWDVTEGSAGAPSDSTSAAGSLARLPDGRDTGSNAMDFRFTPTPTPGGPNP